ncbi:MAG: 3-dehydroquinate synthase [Verrucomicrobiota bacterium]|jgi:3-dehydroquinate synthase|nr:3-dehydroquinate synthase [Verrucomicrobiota bacterium]MDK2963184.1 3-dehydroquinate synthase [Verrucomicrobiota bacterium]
MNCDIQVDLGDRSYPIHIGSGILDSLGEACKTAGLTGRCLVVADENVAPLYADRTFQSLEKAGFFPALTVLSAGEPTKCQTQLLNLYSAAAAHGLDRQCFMVALGGGVMGDLTGFAAASWLRGIRFVQVPTSLLAMVDSSVGGKTGINIPEGKNLVGAFHQPELVLIDLDTLSTLPPREFAAGMAEVVKYGIIRDADLFDVLERNTLPQRSCFQGSEKIGDVIARCCEIKADVVRQDEREGGLRGILNFGHTAAHAIENVAGYGQYLHGEAVAIGMVYAAHLSVVLKGLSIEESARIEKLLTGLSLPVGAPKFAWKAIRTAMAVDKKTVGGLPKFVLADRLGHAVFGCEVPEELLEEVWDGIRQ